LRFFDVAGDGLLGAVGSGGGALVRAAPAR
jgi:hypothetical protein